MNYWLNNFYFVNTDNSSARPKGNSVSVKADNTIAEFRCFVQHLLYCEDFLIWEAFNPQFLHPQKLRDKLTHIPQIQRATFTMSAG